MTFRLKLTFFKFLFQVEKNKLSRVYFADIYKEYESIHKYLTNLTGTYKELLNEPTQTSYFEMKKDEVKPDTEQNDECNRDSEEKKDESIEDKKSNETITVKSKKVKFELCQYYFIASIFDLQIHQNFLLQSHMYFTCNNFS